MSLELTKCYCLVQLAIKVGLTDISTLSNCFYLNLVLLVHLCVWQVWAHREQRKSGSQRTLESVLTFHPYVDFEDQTSLWDKCSCPSPSPPECRDRSVHHYSCLQDAFFRCSNTGARHYHRYSRKPPGTASAPVLSSGTCWLASHSSFNNFFFSRVSFALFFLACFFLSASSFSLWTRLFSPL